MRYSYGLLIVVIAFTFPRTADAQAELAGAWTIQKVVIFGNDASEDFQGRFVEIGDKMFVEKNADGQVLARKQITFGKMKEQIDFAIDGKPIAIGRWRITDGYLELSIRAASEDRPTGFESTVSNKVIYFRLRKR